MLGEIRTVAPTWVKVMPRTFFLPYSNSRSCNAVNFRGRAGEMPQGLRAPAAQTCRPEFGFQNLCNKVDIYVCLSTWMEKGGDRSIAGAYWLPDYPWVYETRMSERPCCKMNRQRVIEEDTQILNLHLQINNLLKLKQKYRHEFPKRELLSGNKQRLGLEEIGT